MKEAGVDFISTCIDLNGMKTLAQELDRQGMGDVTMLHPNTYNQQFVKDNADLFEGDYVGVVFRAIDGSFATGAGDVVVLEFEALRPGTSRIELRDVKSVDAGGEANRDVVVTNASVTIH